MKQLIVNADDFGISAGVNRGILHTHHRGIVTSTTVMINFPDAAPGLEQALAAAPDLGIGLHFNLTAGPPVAPPSAVPSLLTDAAVFHSIAAWPDRLANYDGDQIQLEMHAQWDRFVELTGRPPDHLDAHHHATYLHPTALHTMLDLSRAYRIPLRNAQVDASFEASLRILQDMMPALHADEARRLIEKLQAVIDESPQPFWPARLEMNFSMRSSTLGELLVLLTTLPDDSLTELLTHPGYVDSGIAHSRLQDRREVEIEHLTHPATLECVQAEGIQLITFGDLPYG